MPRSEIPSPTPDGITGSPKWDTPTPEATTEKTPKRQLNPWIAGVIGAVLGAGCTALIFSGAIPGSAPSTNEAQKQLEEAVSTCDDPVGFLLSDEGRSLVFDTEGKEEDSGGSVADLACILFSIETPAHVIDQMDRTTALAGNQSANWGNFEMQWSYHPDRGTDGAIIAVDSD